MKKLNKYVITAESAKTNHYDIKSYDFNNTGIEVIEEFNTLKAAKEEFKNNYKYNDVNPVTFGFEITFYYLQKVEITVDENNNKIGRSYEDLEELEVSKFEFEDEKEYKELKELINCEENENSLLTYYNYDNDYFFSSNQLKENLIVIYNLLNKENLLNIAFYVVEKIEENYNIHDEKIEEDEIEEIKNIMNFYKENGYFED